MGMTPIGGPDWLLRDAPPLVAAPLTLLDLSRSLRALDVAAAVAAEQVAMERAASAQAAASDAQKRAGADPADQALAALAAEAAHLSLAAEADLFAASEALAASQDWEGGFQYLPELSNAESMETWQPDSGATKRTTATSDATDACWYDPFTVVAHDDRSMYGVPFEERVGRAQRALLAHEPWQVEREFWGGAECPTNYHLTASPNTPTTGPRRTIDAWPNPTAPPGTTLGTAVGIRKSLAALDQAIANADAGVGMIHATPYVVQLWASMYPFLRDSVGRVYTVNFNQIVPGYGYPGTGPDSPTRTVADGVTNSTTTVTSATAAFTSADIGRPISGAGIPTGATIVTVTSATAVVISSAATASASGVSVTVTGQGGDASASSSQWAYATDAVYHLNGAVFTYPWDLRQGAPEVVVNNSLEVRAERNHALITNRLLRAAVLIDTTNVT